jgi:MYXO-CTERM domain-containing protein
LIRPPLSRFVALTLALASLLVVMLGFTAEARAASCSTGTTITSLPFSATNQSNSTGSNNVGTVPLACNTHFTQVAGPEQVFAVQVNDNSNFSITVTPTSAWDPSIYLVTADAGNACQATSCTSGFGADANGVSLAETLSFTNLAAGTYYLVVDSFYATTDGRSSGTFNVDVTGTLGGTPTTTTVVSSANPLILGAPLILTATVTPNSGTGTPTGTVTFVVDGGAPVVTSLNGGSATFTPTLIVGPHIITASYGGDTSFNASTTTFTQQVNVDPATVTLTAAPSPGNFGQAAVFTATVSAANVVPSGGTVTFTVDGVSSAPVALTGVTASFSRTDLEAGDHVVTAHYSGDSRVSSGDSAPLPYHVNPAATTITLTEAPLPEVAFGTPVLFTATVSSGAGTPGGNVVFNVDGTPTSVGLSGGVAALTLSALPVGPHAITASYNGTTDFAASGPTTPVTVMIDGLGTTITLVATPEPSDASQAVTFTATVSPSPGPETGTLIFTIDGTDQPASAIDAGGLATLQTSTLSPGPHSITVRYLGDATHNASSTGPLLHTVNKITSSITLTADITTAVFLQPITFTASVTPTTSAFGSPSGTVEFFDGATSVGTATLDGAAKATLPATFPVGSHSITAKFASDSNFTGSSSTATLVTVNQAQTTTDVYSASNPTILGHPLTIFTLVKTVAPGGGTPSGTVTYFEGATSLGTATLDATGNGSLPVTLGVGDHVITGIYAGTDSYAGSTSASITLTISETGADMVLKSSADPAPRGTPVTFTATILGVGVLGQPTGDVVFTADGKPLGTATLDDSHTASVTTADLSGGSHTITAVYQGDANFPPGTQAQFVERISAALTTTTVTSSKNPSPFGTNVTFTVTVTSAVTGTIDGTAVLRDGLAVLGVANVTGGSATFSTTALKAGFHDISAAYSGNTDFAPSTSTALQQEITGGPQQPVGTDGGAPPAPDAGAPSSDAGAGAGADAGTPIGSSDGSTNPPSPFPTLDGGAFPGLNIGGGSEDCSCRTVGTSGASGGMAFATALGFAAAFIRRRRSRRS